MDEEAHQEEEELREQMMRRDHRDGARLRRPEADVRREDELRREVDKGGGSAARATAAAAAAAAAAAHGAYGARGLRVELRGDDEDVGGEAGEERAACKRGVGSARVAEYKHNRLIKVMGGGAETEAEARDGHRLPELPEQLVGGEHLQFVSFVGDFVKCSVAIRGNPWPSVAIDGNPWPSVVIGSNQAAIKVFIRTHLV